MKFFQVLKIYVKKVNIVQTSFVRKRMNRTNQFSLQSEEISKAVQDFFRLNASATKKVEDVNGKMHSTEKANSKVGYADMPMEDLQSHLP